MIPVLLTLLACPARFAHWTPPVVTLAEETEGHAGAPGDWRLRATEARLLFPEVGVDDEMTAEVRVHAERAWDDADRRVLDGVTLRFLDARGVPLEVGIATSVMVAGDAVVAVQAGDVGLPPCGAWLAVDRFTLRRACPLAVPIR